MFKFCRQVETENVDMLNNIQPCQEHNIPCSFICLEQECSKKALMCIKCLQQHKTHNWESLQKYFHQDFRKALAQGTSLHYREVDDFIDTMLTQIDRMRAKFNKKFDDLNNDIRFEMEQIKKHYPHKGKFVISGQTLTNQNAHLFKEIRQSQQHSNWMQPATAYITRMFRETAAMALNLIDDFHANLSGRQWFELTPETSIAYVDKFMKQYEGVYSADPHYFKFSLDQKAQNIRVSQNQRQIKFFKSSPSRPTVVSINPLSRNKYKIYFQIAKLQKTIVVFDKQLIVLGACLPNILKNYGYRGITQASHGGLGIGSNGKCYHTRLLKYEKSDSGFTFGEQDIVSVQIDYELKIIKFEKTNGFFKKKFEMELGLEDNEIPLLKPCVMFDGEEGAVVQILEEHETTKKYQKNKKKVNKQKQKK